MPILEHSPARADQGVDIKRNGLAHGDSAARRLLGFWVGRDTTWDVLGRPGTSKT